MATPIGILASMMSAHLSSFESIQTVTVGAGGVTTISLTAIPQTYKHLQLRLIGGSSVAPAVLVRFNADAASNYSGHYLSGNGATPSAGWGLSTACYICQQAGLGTSGSMFGVAIADILDYTNANKYKTLRSIGGWDQNGSGAIDLNSGNWRSASAITQIDLIMGAGANWTIGSSVALYGSK